MSVNRYITGIFIVCIAVPVLRRTRPNLPRPFKTPLVPLIPILGVVISLAEMIALPFDTWLRLVVWLLLGLVIILPMVETQPSAAAKYCTT